MLRRWTLLLTGLLAAALTAGCARPVPLTTDIRNGYSATDLAQKQFQVQGHFELRAGGSPTLTMKEGTHATAARVVDDSTVVLDVPAGNAGGGSETLALTFRPSANAAGAYALRAVNGAALGASIPVGTTQYQYFTCYLNVDWYCSAGSSGFREDQGVRLAIRK